MQLTRYDPVRELGKIERDLNKFWDNDWGIASSVGISAPIDVYEEENNLVAEISLPNFNKDEVTVSIEDGILEVSANHEERAEKNDKRHYLFRETTNQYYRRISLPANVKEEKTDASFKNGLLKITMELDNTKKKSRLISIK